MPLIIWLSGRDQPIVLKGEFDEREWRHDTIIAEEEGSGAAMVIFRSQVLFIKELSDAEWTQAKTDAQKMQEDAQRHNPNPGNAPRVIVPSNRR